MSQHSALSGHSTKRTPQSEPIPGSSQVENSAGGYSYEADLWDRVQRFLILGTEGGTYYVSERDLTKANTASLALACKEDGQRLVELTVGVSTDGRAASNDPALYALAYAAKKGDEATRRVAHKALPLVARTGTHLFHFAQYVQNFGGWGRATKRAIAEWYGRDIDDVAFQTIKYRQRDGWTHRDLLRLSHPEPDTAQHDALFKWITKGYPYAGELNLDHDIPVVENFIRAQQAESPADSAKLIRETKLPREAILSEHLNSLSVWEALVGDMPYTATLRNLTTMTINGLLDKSQYRMIVTERLLNDEAIEKSRVHPAAILSALVTYESGRSLRSGKSWSPHRQIIDALNDAFYKSFGNVVPTGKRTLLALDISGSMSIGSITGNPDLTPRVASAAVALVTASVEREYQILGFSHELIPLNISPRQRLDDAVRAISGLPFGGTDCALPMLWALQKKQEIDSFVVYTDNETWAGQVHPSEALAEYRRVSGIDAKLVVVGMAANDFTIADPNDPGMLDVVGFDTNTPNIISEFLR